MQRKFSFVSGLPCARSTHFGAILKQNPRFAAGRSSPVASLFEGMVSQVSLGNELSRMADKTQRARILEGLFDRFCANVAERAMIYTRTDALAASNRLVGFSYQALREACWSDHADRIVIVDYDMLAVRPGDVLRLLYQFIDRPWFEHDFETVSYTTKTFDTALGHANLHTVRPSVEAGPRASRLPPDLFGKYAGLDFWRDLKNGRAFRFVNQSATAAATSTATAAQISAKPTVS